MAVNMYCHVLCNGNNIREIDGDVYLYAEGNRHRFIDSLVIMAIII